MKEFFLTLYIFLSACPVLCADQRRGNRFIGPLQPRVYALEIGGRLAGYCVEKSYSSNRDGRQILVYSSKTVVQSSTGKTTRSALYRLDDKSGRMISAGVDYSKGYTKERRTADFDKGDAVYSVVRNGETKESRTIALPDDTCVSCCLAYPVLELLNAEKKEHTMKVFSINDSSVCTVTVKREGEEVLEYHGKEYQCGRFSLDRSDGAGRTLLWVTENGELVKLERPAEKLVYRPADPKTAEKLVSKAREAIGFFPVDAGIDNRSALTFLCLNAVIEAPDIKDVSRLSTRRQTFQGALKEGKAAGTFMIRSFHYQPGEALVFPTPPEAVFSQSEFLKVDPLIESGSREILRRALTETEGLKNRWHAAHSLGLWVSRNIRLDLSEKKGALETMTEGKGCSAGMARLHVALCRSVLIPARVVAGMIYIRTGEGGGFAGHSWSEVRLGEMGWVPMDPAAGQLSFLDAGHLRLDGGGTVKIEAIEVLDYIPKPEESRAPVALKPFCPPVETGESLRYAYFMNGERSGTEETIFLGADDADSEPAGFTFVSATALNNISGEIMTRFDSEGRLLQHRADFGDALRLCVVREGEVFCESREGERATKKTVPLPREGLFFDNNQVFHLGLMLSRLDIEPGRIVQIGVFHPSAMRILTLQVEYKGRQEVNVRGENRLLHHYSLLGGFQRMEAWLDDSGKLIKESEQGGKIEIVLEEKNRKDREDGQ